MAKLPVSFKAKDVVGRMGFENIPNDDYTAILEKSEAKVTKETASLPKSQQVTYLNFQWKITEGQYKGRTLFNILNINHEKDNVREIAMKELATICDACEKVSISDTEELHGIEITIVVGTDKGSAQYPPKNVIRGYKPLKGAKKPTLGKDDEEEAPKKKTNKVTFG